MPRPVCSTCECEMVLVKVGVAVAIFSKSVGPTKPYQVWSGDEFGCNSCHARVVCRYAEGPFYEHFHEGAVPALDIKVVEHSLKVKV